MKKALVIDDHPVTHLGCRRLLNDAGFETVLEARTCDDGFRALDRDKPDLIVLDLGLPGLGGLAMIAQLLDRMPGVKVLVFSMHEDPIFAARALEAGAHGYLTKSSRPEDFASAIETIRSGKIFLELEMATQLAVLQSGRTKNPLNGIASRDLRVLRLIGKGLNNADIANQLDVSYKTVANTCARLRSKMNAKSRADLIRIAIESENWNVSPEGPPPEP